MTDKVMHFFGLSAELSLPKFTARSALVARNILPYLLLHLDHSINLSVLSSNDDPLIESLDR